MKIIYIMGYGRSGSTLLDIILGDNEEIISTGALDNFHHWVEHNYKCSCGEPIKHCAYWGEIINCIQFKKEEADLMRNMDSMRSIFIRKSEKDVCKYCQLTNRLLSKVVGSFGKGTVVDSSKTARDSIFRPVMLAKYCHIDLKPIFLVRDPRGVVWSAMKMHGSPERSKNDVPLTRFFRTLISWNLTNLMTLIIIKLALSRCLFVRYEDFCKDPPNTLRRIEDFAEVRLKTVIDKIDDGSPIIVGHNLGGNRLRFSKAVDRIRIDESWKKDMPMFHRGLVTIASYPLIKYFGY